MVLLPFAFLSIFFFSFQGNNENSVATGGGGGTNSNTSTLSSPTLPIYYDGHSNSPPLSNSMTPHCMLMISNLDL